MEVTATPVYLGCGEELARDGKDATRRPVHSVILYDGTKPAASGDLTVSL